VCVFGLATFCRMIVLFCHVGQVRQALSTGASLYDIDVELLRQIKPDVIVTQVVLDSVYDFVFLPMSLFLSLFLIFVLVLVFVSLSFEVCCSDVDMLFFQPRVYVAYALSI
jgi:hypothetical protein